METIKQTYGANGYKLTLLAQKGLTPELTLALYLLRKGKRTPGYELQLLRSRGPDRMPTGEVRGYLWRHPSNEDFGKWGWSYQGKELAFQKFNAFVLPKKA